MQKLVLFIKKYTIDQLQAIDQEYRTESPTPTMINKVVGLYLIVALVLFARHFIYRDIFAIFWGDLPRPSAERYFWRRHFWIWFLTFIYAVPPYLYGRYVLGLRLKDMGFVGKGFWKHLPIYLVFFAIVFPAAYTVSHSEIFIKKYPLYLDAGNSPLHFFRWELSYAIYFISVEFFYRGFLLFGAVRTIGVACIPIMVMPYMMIHYAKPQLECLGSIIAGMALGIVALRTKSIYAGILLHIAIALSMDLLVLGHKGKLDTLFPFLF